MRPEEKFPGFHGKDMLNSLGVLLWAVARADGRIRQEEVDKIKSYLESLGMRAQEAEDFAAAAKKREEERIDIFQFIRQMAKTLDYSQKLALIKDLFRLAFSDKELASEEREAIREISQIFYISHADFIKAKLAAQKEAGLKTLDF